MPITAQEIYDQVVLALPPTERLRLATLILNELVQQGSAVQGLGFANLFANQSDMWTEQDQIDLTNFSLQYAAPLFSDEETVE